MISPNFAMGYKRLGTPYKRDHCGLPANALAQARQALRGETILFQVVVYSKIHY